MEKLRAVLTTELRRKGFGNEAIADTAVHEYLHTHTLLIRQLLNEKEWNNILLTLHPNRTENDVERIIGFGCAVADFSAGFLCNEAQQQRILQLAGLCNLLAALYDYYMDHPVNGESFSVSRKALQLALTENDFTALEHTAHTGTIRERVMYGLIQHYLQLLHEAEQEQSASAQYRRTFYKLILQMFDAQNATIGNANINSHQLMRKSAQAVVALALPVWLMNVQNKSCSYFRHLLWLYRLGDFISWVDDFADFENDRAQNLPNRLLSDHEMFPYERAVRVAAAGAKIWADRENFNIQDVSHTNPNYLLTYFVYKWLK